MSSNLKVCKKCNSNDIEVDRARGITYCTNCGNVLEESIIVSEIQIEEGAGGGMNVIGQFVGANDTRGITINGLQNSLRESKEVTLQNGKRLINEMGSQLRLNQHCMDTAFNFYKLAVQRGLTRGRKIRQVIAACLYLVCRTEGTPHMLLDLCDIVHDDACYISSLGKLAMKFAYLLCIKLPEIDPGLFIPRFAQKLDFGEKTHDVTLTALRLVQRMNRDWMATGRRPSGLCGAALLVSARMYDFKPSLDDIVKVVKIGKTTLRKRMLEFEDTPSSNLTVDEFHSIDLEEEHDPPSFTRSKKFNKIKQIEEMTNIQEIEREIIQLQESIEAALNDLQAKPRGLLGSYAKLARFEDQILGPNKQLTNIDAEIKETQEFLSEDQINIIRSIVGTTSKDLPVTVIPEISENLRPTLRSLGLVRETTTTKTDNLDIITEVDLEDDLTDESDELDSLSSDLSGNEDEDEEGLDTTLDEDNEDHDNDIDLEMIRKRSKRFKRKRKLKRQRKLNERILAKKSMQEVALPPPPQVVDHVNCPLMEKIEEIMPEKIEKVIGEEKSETTEEGIAAEKTDELDLTGIDDQEIDAMLLSKDEIKTKAKLWLRANKDWLKEQKEREDIKKKEREESNKFELKPKKARIRKPKNTTPVANPQEAIDRMLQEKRLSSKINYDVLKNLNKDLKKT